MFIFGLYANSSPYFPTTGFFRSLVLSYVHLIGFFLVPRASETFGILLREGFPDLPSPNLCCFH